MRTRDVVPGLLVIVALAGCGGGSSGGQTAPTTPAITQPPSSTPPPTIVAPTATATATVTQTSAPAAPTSCTSAQLHLSLGDSQGAAGTFYQPVVFTNNGATACTLRAYPGVSYTGAGGVQLGYAAAHDGGTPKTISLAAHGGQASALLRQRDPGVFAPSACHSKKAIDLRVYPPGETHALATADPTTVCTTKQGRSGIGVIKAGNDPAP